MLRHFEYDKPLRISNGVLKVRVSVSNLEDYKAGISNGVLKEGNPHCQLFRLWHNRIFNGVLKAYADEHALVVFCV